MTQDTAHMPLDERGLDAALKVFEADHGENSEAYLSAAIRAYLQTAAADVSGLVAQPCTCHPDDNPPSPCAEKYALSACLAASTLQTLSASNAALEAEIERLRGEMQPGTETAQVAECATEGCERTATVRFERGGIGSDYCRDCYMRVQALTAAQEADR